MLRDFSWISLIWCVSWRIKVEFLVWWKLRWSIKEDPSRQNGPKIKHLNGVAHLSLGGEDGPSIKPQVIKGACSEEIANVLGPFNVVPITIPITKHKKKTSRSKKNSLGRYRSSLSLPTNSLSFARRIMVAVMILHRMWRFFEQRYRMPS